MSMPTASLLASPRSALITSGGGPVDESVAGPSTTTALALIHTPVFVFNTHLEAEEAIQALSRAKFDVTRLSLIGKGYHTEEHPVGFYTAGDRIKSWGSMGAFWGGIWGLLIGPAMFLLPGIGLVALVGPVVAALVAALEGAVVVGGLSALGAAFVQMGVSEEHAIRYETALKADKYVLVVHGNADEVAQAQQVLAGRHAWKAA